MNTRGEKIIFGFLGAITAIIIGFAVYFDTGKTTTRTPASQQEQIEYTPFPYFFD